jgi:hypothetical protein
MFIYRHARSRFGTIPACETVCATDRYNAFCNRLSLMLMSLNFFALPIPFLSVVCIAFVAACDDVFSYFWFCRHNLFRCWQGVRYWRTQPTFTKYVIIHFLQPSLCNTKL